MPAIDDVLGQLAALPLNDMASALERFPPDQLTAIKKHLTAATAKSGKRWFPNSGPQSDAYFSLADQLLYGGQVGGGKTQILLGLATQEHKRSLILRRLNVEVPDLVDHTANILGHREGFNGQTNRWRLPDGRLIQFGGCQHLGDEKKYKGQAKSFVGVDEASEFLEEQIDYIIGWLRSADSKERCRLVLATNPPTSTSGEWVVRWFAPWLDPQHPMFPTAPGKLLYFVRDKGAFRFFETEEEAFAHMETMENPPRDLQGKLVRPLTRTFIRSGLADNPDYAKTDYAARLAQLPEPLRRRYEQGDFTAGAEDDEWQCIPTAWIVAAQDRWRRRGGVPPPNVPMTAIAEDVAQGGSDNTIVAPRHDFWYAPLIIRPGIETPLPSDAAALIVKNRRDGAVVVIDVGGGYGGGVIERLKDNGIAAVPFNGANASTARTKDRALGFFNFRAEAIWRFREALDPDQFGGSIVELPDEQSLRAQLASYRWKLTQRGIQVEDKLETKKRIGRSPDESDAVIMCWSQGNAAIRRGLGGPGSTGWSRPTVSVGHAGKKGRR